MGSSPSGSDRPKRYRPSPRSSGPRTILPSESASVMSAAKVGPSRLPRRSAGRNVSSISWLPGNARSASALLARSALAEPHDRGHGLAAVEAAELMILPLDAHHCAIEAGRVRVREHRPEAAAAVAIETDRLGSLPEIPVAPRVLKECGDPALGFRHPRLGAGTTYLQRFHCGEHISDRDARPRNRGCDGNRAIDRPSVREHLHRQAERSPDLVAQRSQSRLVAKVFLVDDRRRFVGRARFSCYAQPPFAARRRADGEDAIEFTSRDLRRIRHVHPVLESAHIESLSQLPTHLQH